MGTAGSSYGSAMVNINSKSEAGHTVCQKLDNGQTPTQVANEVLDSSVMPAYHSGYFVGASIKLYCPQYTPEVSGT